MKTLSILSNPASWRATTATFAEQPLYLDTIWATYKRRQGWTVSELSLPGAAALVQTRRLTRFGPTVTLIQGGPVLAPGADARTALDTFLRHANPGRFGIELVYPAQATSGPLHEALTATGFRPLPMAGTGTVLLDLSRSEPDLRAALSKNWRHNLSRAEKRGLEIRWVPCDPAARAAAADRMAALYRALTERKGFAGALDAVALIEATGDDDRLEFLEVWKDDVLHASRMGWVGGRTGLDLLAASSDAARNSYANYLALWTLIQRMRERGAESFDCGGIDPTGNEGVYNFKKGLGGIEVHTGKLWLRARPAILAPLLARRLGSGS